MVRVCQCIREAEIIEEPVKPVWICEKVMCDHDKCRRKMKLILMMSLWLNVVAYYLHNMFHCLRSITLSVVSSLTDNVADLLLLCLYTVLIYMTWVKHTV